MSATPPPTNQQSYSVNDVGTVPLSAAGLNSSNWPPAWGVAPPATATDPGQITNANQVIQYMGLNLYSLFGAVNGAMLNANTAYAQGQHPPSWVAILLAMNNLNQFLSGRYITMTNGRLELPFASTVNSTDPWQSYPFTGAFPNYPCSGSLEIHVDGEQYANNSGFGSWQVVTGFELVVGSSSAALDLAPAASEEDEDVGGGTASSSSYRASSSGP